MHVPVTRASSLRFEETVDRNRIRLALGGALLCLVVLGARGARADEAKPAEPVKPSAPSLTDVLGASGIDLHGYMDAAYSYLSGAGVFTSGVADRVFDTEPNSFNVHQATLIVDYQPKEGCGGLVTSRPEETPGSSPLSASRRVISTSPRLSRNTPTVR